MVVSTELSAHNRLGSGTIVTSQTYINSCYIYRNHAISPRNRLLLTLRFLATGYFFICAGDTMGISKTAAHDIIQLVVDAIVQLRREFIHFPATPQGIRELVNKFFAIARFPTVVGAIDCTHIRVQSPGNLLKYSYKLCKSEWVRDVLLQELF